ncbi:MAG: twin-arginine translocase subunit TatC [Planctomycetota bacterium]
MADKSEDDEQRLDSTRMGLGEHLAELRTRLIRAVIVLGVLFAVLYNYRHPALELMQGPKLRATALLRERQAENWAEEFKAQLAKGETIDASDKFQPGWPEKWVLRDDVGPGRNLISWEADGGFFIRVRLCFMLSLLFGGPYVLWELWGFIAAGLYKREKRVIYAYFPVSLLLFFSGVYFGYRYLVTYALYFTNLDGLGAEDISYMMSLSGYLDFLKALSLAMGFVFQLPVVMVVLSRIDLVQPEIYSKYRKHMLVGALVMGAILTPPDPYTQILMAVPIVLLYEIGLRFAWWLRPTPIIPEGEADAAAS